MVKRGIFFFLFLYMFLVATTWASSPITINSDRIEILQKKGLAVFIGHVKAYRADFTLTADRLKVFYVVRDHTKEVIKMEAEGKISLTKGEWKARADKALYLKKEEKIILQGHPVVYRNKEKIKGGRVILFLLEDKSVIEAEPGEKAEAVVYTGD